MNDQTYVTLNNGAKIPQFGLGVFMIMGDDNTEKACLSALEAGNIVFPKSTNPQHIRDNINIFDFSLTDEEMQSIAALDRGERFFRMSLEEQEKNLSAFVPAD